MRADQNAQALVQAELAAEKLARPYAEARQKAAALVKAIARQNLEQEPVTPAQQAELEREVGRELDLRRDWHQIQAQIQETSHGLHRAQSRAVELERALALALEQARSSTRAQAQAQARSARSKALAVAQLLRRLLRGQRSLWDGIVRNLYLGMGVAALLVWMLPKADRARWRQESYSELETLKQEGAPLLGTAIRIALRVPRLAAVLWTPPTRRWLARLKPLWIGLGTAAATLMAGFAGLGQSPTDGQVRSLIAAALLAGMVAASQAHKGQSHRRKR